MIRPSQKGIALLITVVIAFIIMALGLGVFALLFDEIGFAASQRESIKAFYAADSGVECTLYWDVIRWGGFDIDGDTSVFIDPANTYPSDGLRDFSDLVCGDSATLIPPVVVTPGATTTVFEVNYPNGTCAHVSYERRTTFGVEGIIISDGKNLPCGTVSDRLLERSLEVTFP